MPADQRHRRMRRLVPQSLRLRATFVLAALTAVALVASAVAITQLVRGSVASSTRQELQQDLLRAIDFVDSATAPAPGFGPRLTMPGTIEALNGGAVPGCATPEQLAVGDTSFTLTEFDRLPTPTPSPDQEQAADNCAHRVLGHATGPTEQVLTECYDVAAASYGNQRFTYDQATAVEYSDQYASRVSACLQQRDPATRAFTAAAHTCEARTSNAFGSIDVLGERTVLKRFGEVLDDYVGCLHDHGQTGIPTPVINTHAHVTQVSLPSLGTVQTVVLPATHPLVRGLDRFGQGLFVAIPVLVLAVFGLAFLAVGAVLQPVERMRSQVDVISERSLGQRVEPPRRGDEIARLATTLNRMLERLEEAATRQRQFISDASHELRTPIATVRTEVDLLRAHPDHLQANDALVNIDQQVARVEHLIDDLFALAVYDETESGALQREDVDLDHLISTELAQRNDVHPINVSLEPARVRGDTSALARVLSNLLDNAERFAASRVDVTLRRDAGRAVLTVDDDGPGIPADERQRIFERLVRGEERHDRGHSGSGLGLAIAQRVVRGHDGTITAGESPIGGAQLRVELPLNES